MKKFVLILFLLFSLPFLGIGFCFAQGTGSGVTYKSVEKDLFPTWKGSGTQNESRIRLQMTALEKEELNKFDTLLKTQRANLAKEQKLLSEKQPQINTITADMNVLTLQIQTKNCFMSEDCLATGDCFGDSTVTPECAQLIIESRQKYDELSKIQKEVSTSQSNVLKLQSDIKYLEDERDILLSQVFNRLNIYPQGVFGENADKHFLIQYIPLAIDILMKFFAPVIVIILVYTGVRFIYAGDQDEELGKAKQNLMYAFLGFLFVVLSYSLMKAIYFFFAG